ncbi:MAG: 2,5-diamino-6-(ribosylamino)-4(3H)-pyrimidinone 5'-phosphate reductase [Methanobacteriaceae archaeon]
MKPQVLLNAAMTVDGKIATRTGSSEISGKEDLLMVHKIRKEMDAIMVGIKTVLADDPRLTVHKITAEPEVNPIRIVVDSQGRTPIKARVLNDDARTIVVVSDNASQKKIKHLQERAEVIFCGQKKIDLSRLMEKLCDIGIKTLMLEGGSTLNYSMLREGLVNEIRVCIAPMIAGGIQAKSLVGGEGVDYMKDAFRLKFKKSYTLGEDLIVEYKVLN